MNKIHEWINTGLIALVIILGLVGGNHQSGNLGAASTTNLPSLAVAQLNVGSGCGDAFTSCVGTGITSLITGTCNLVGQGNVDTMNGVQVATTSCAVTGELTGDKVFVQLNQASTTNPGAWPAVVQSAYASSSSGAITVVLYNSTTTASQVTKIGSSTQYFIVR